MHLIVFSTERLTRQYGVDGVTRLWRRTDRLASARRLAGVESLRLAPEEGLSLFDVPPADGGDPEALHGQISRLAEALARRGRPLESVLLIGGPAALPFFPCDNPMLDEAGPIAADYPYGAYRPDELLMDWAVGRLPAGDGDDPRQLLRLLKLAAEHHKPQRGSGVARPAFGYCAAAWRGPSVEVYTQLDRAERLLLSPPLTADTLDRGVLAAAQLVFCNLHGVRTRPTWYGQSADGRGQLVVALRARDLEHTTLTATAIVSTACYGAYSPAYDLSETIAVQALLRGAACFVGSTAITYGPANLPLSGADLLAYHFFRAALEPRIRAGQALRLARERTLADTYRSQRFLDDDDLKNMITFVLYGDPSLPLI